MIAQALRGHLDRDASRIKLANNTKVELCPDELTVLAEIRAAGQYISPSRLHRMYLRWRGSADVDYDFGRYVLTYRDDTGEQAALNIDGYRARVGGVS